MKSLILCLSLILPIQSFAQTSQIKSARRGVATVILSGLGGAVLGLSTLSFYPQPQEHINNVTTGFGVGLVAGTIYVLLQGKPPTAEEAAWEIPEGKQLTIDTVLIPANTFAFVQKKPALFSWEF